MLGQAVLAGHLHQRAHCSRNCAPVALSSRPALGAAPAAAHALSFRPARPGCRGLRSLHLRVLQGSPPCQERPQAGWLLLAGLPPHRHRCVCRCLPLPAAGPAPRGTACALLLLASRLLVTHCAATYRPLPSETPASCCLRLSPLYYSQRSEQPAVMEVVGAIDQVRLRRPGLQPHARLGTCTYMHSRWQLPARPPAPLPDSH